MAIAAGRILNPRTARGQILGTLIMCTSLFEGDPWECGRIGVTAPMFRPAQFF